MDGWHLRLSSWALSSIGRAMGTKPRDASSSPVEFTFFPPNTSKNETSRDEIKQRGI